MVSYAFKRGCTDIVLVYPNIFEEIMPSDNFEITSGFNGKETINITAVEIPFWSIKSFKDLDNKLIGVLDSTLKTIMNTPLD